MDWLPLLAVALFLFAILLTGWLLLLPARRVLQAFFSRPRAPHSMKAISVHIIGQAPFSLQPRRRWRWGELTAREMDVARLAVQGHGDRAIASALGISIRTVQTHMQNICRKLEIRSRHEIKHRLDVDA